MQDEIIKRAIAHHHAEQSPDAASVATAMVALLRSLYSELRLLVGSDAAAALYAHAVHRTRAALHWTLPPTSTVDDAVLALLRDDLAARSFEDASAACETLLAAVVDHLANLIGEPLTYRLLNSTWKPVAAEQTDQEKFE